MSSRKSTLSRLAWLVAAPLTLGASMLASTPASAQLTQVTGWQQGTEPSYITMYEHVPSKLAANAPILVVIHYCGGNASGIYGEAQGGNIVSTSDSMGVLMVLPQLNGRNCWDVATTPSLTHATGTTAGGDTKAIVDMVKYEIAHRSVNPNRVYAIGSSSGAMMTEALLAVYPDVFKGGSEFAGVPAGCWSASYTESNQWSGPCAGGQVTKTAQAWGDAVRAMYPGYSGFRPRIQLWHGTADSTINYNNQTEAVKQWTNVMGLSGNGSSSSVTISGHAYTRVQWTNSCNQTVLDEWSETNGPHGTDANMNGQYSMPFFALDTAANVALATDPQAGCGTTTGTGGSGGTTGAGGSAGTVGTGGTTTARGGAGGTTARGGAGGSAGGTTGAGGITNTPGTGGSAQGTGGSTQGAGGSTQGAGGSTQGAGGSSNPGTGGTIITGTGGTDNSGAGGSSNPGTGGDNSVGAGGSSNPGTGGDNTSGSGGTTGAGGTTTETGPSAPGCACEVGGASGAFNALALAGLFAIVLGRRRAKKRSAAKR